ncbi:hypothetical protein EGW08_001088 [Elysia chlorotica]|uniref:Uncharacterized protein n=1 Tax=Elysia chlorotica TaxID=188477 RepID=A0A433UBF8_ELYCH|nr:hypothetical protein EGW08_001088 [Elysia chlorotica]
MSDSAPSRSFIAGLKPPSRLSLGSNIQESWKLFKQRWDTYSVLSQIFTLPRDVQVALFLHCLDDDVLKTYNGNMTPEASAAVNDLPKQRNRPLSSSTRPQSSSKPPRSANCKFFGRHHLMLKNKCPAYGKECSKCHVYCYYYFIMIYQKEHQTLDLDSSTMSDSVLSRSFIAGLKPPSRLSLGSNIQESWNLFKQRWDTYSVLSQISTLPRYVQVAMFLHCLDDDALKTYSGNRTAVNALPKQRNRPLSSSTRPQSSSRPLRSAKCKFCGRHHPMLKSKCPAYGKECSKCHGIDFLRSNDINSYKYQEGASLMTI